ncbi:Serine/Arginine-related protein 53 [Chelonia mydas]|uniref:Serine/Arginine-related protein 53 n=1 Tax=Chelonia mydas TaxID=8469 RepID=M7BAX8_CHEMY|nr:Serine/Arginine-related protein 53 [Chelonia mydas]
MCGPYLCYSTHSPSPLLQIQLDSDQATLVEQVKRVKEIEAIESDSFVPQTFRSSKEVKKSTEAGELKCEPATVGVGTVDLSNTEKEIAPGNIPTAIKYQDDNSLAHPNCSVGKLDCSPCMLQKAVASHQHPLLSHLLSLHAPSNQN